MYMYGRACNDTWSSRLQTRDGVIFHPCLYKRLFPYFRSTVVDFMGALVWSLIRRGAQDVDKAFRGGAHLKARKSQGLEHDFQR